MPEVATLAPPNDMLSAVKVMLEEDVSTLVAAFKPNVAVPMLMPKCVLSLIPTMMMGPDLAKMLPFKVVATSVLTAVPDIPVIVMPPPRPVASIIPLKLMPNDELVAFTSDASPTREIASAEVLAERRVNPGP